MTGSMNSLPFFVLSRGAGSAESLSMKKKRRQKALPWFLTNKCQNQRSPSSGTMRGEV